jgi:hypothetical protein
VREAKKVAASLYGDSLDMLPDEDVEIPRPRPTAFLADIRQDPIRWRATLFGWIACFAQSAEFSTSSSSCRHFCRSFFSRCCSRRSARRMRRSSPPFSLAGLLAAIFILPEVYGFELDSSPREMETSPVPSGT